MPETLVSAAGNKLIHLRIGEAMSGFTTGHRYRRDGMIFEIAAIERITNVDLEKGTSVHFELVLLVLEDGRVLRKRAKLIPREMMAEVLE